MGYSSQDGYIPIYMKKTIPKGNYQFYYINQTLKKDILVATKASDGLGPNISFVINRSDYIKNKDFNGPFGSWYVKTDYNPIVKGPIYNFKP